MNIWSDPLTREQRADEDAEFAAACQSYLAELREDWRRIDWTAVRMVCSAGGLALAIAAVVLAANWFLVS